MEERRTFHYDLIKGWEQINDPDGWGSGGSYEDSLEAIGFAREAKVMLGSVYTFSGEWHRPQDGGSAQFPHLIVFSDSESIWHVFTSDFPSALELMHKVTVMAQATVLQNVYEETEAIRLEEGLKSETRQRQAHMRRGHHDVETPG